MPTYYKATRSDGVVATRSTTSKAYTRAFVRPNGMSNWATGDHTPPEASKHQGEVVEAVEITAKEYRELKKGGAKGLARDDR